MELIDKEQLKAEIERYKQGAAIARFDNAGENADYFQGKVDLCDDLTCILDTLPEQPDKETILRICKLHKVWSIMAPWENVEDFIMNNWKTENIV